MSPNMNRNWSEENPENQSQEPEDSTRIILNNIQSNDKVTLTLVIPLI